ncbi:MAG: hypothetical protein M3R70_01295 [Actinomycetota bacterium]|nr:hypothetical protein [Actinomycetota bacterium]
MSKSRVPDENLAQAAEHVVSRLVTVCVVQLLEAVDVEQYECHFAAGPPRGGDPG